MIEWEVGRQGGRLDYGSRVKVLILEAGTSLASSRGIFIPLFFNQRVNLSFGSANSPVKMADNESLELTPREKLRLMKSPIVEGSETGAEMPNLTEFGDRFTDTSIQFARVSPVSRHQGFILSWTHLF